MPRIIRVNKKNKSHLETAVSWAIGAVSAKGAGDVYDYIKSHLSKNGVDHVDENVNDTSSINSEHTYWKK